MVLKMNHKPISILKFGNSVLRDAQEIRVAVQEIYETYRRGHSVVVVVAALGETTNQLIAQAQNLSDSRDPTMLAELLATGESQAGTLVTLALQASGMPARYLNPYQVGLITSGKDPLDHSPEYLPVKSFLKKLEDHPILVIPGFIGLSSQNEITLLGRGGADLTAVFVAHALRAERCILFREMDGIYDQAKRLQTLTWSEVYRISHGRIQSKALHYAEKVGLEIEIAKPGTAYSTRIGRDQTRAAPPLKRPRFRIALLGLGTVGLEIYQEIMDRPELFEITKILVRDPEKHIQNKIPSRLLTRDSNEIFETPCDVIVELLGGTDPASQLIERALSAGIHVVTANQVVIATHGEHLNALARTHHATLLFSASVGGSIPVLETLDLLRKELRLVHDEILSIEAIVPGTTNPLLDGADSAQKIALIGSRAFNHTIDWQSVDYSELLNIAMKELKMASDYQRIYRLIASCRKTDAGIKTEVRPIELSETHPLANLKNEENGFVIYTKSGKVIHLRGKANGQLPTARAVFSDLFDLFRKGIA